MPHSRKLLNIRFLGDMDIVIRKIGAHEAAHLRDISIRTFEETFAGDNSAEDMSNYILHNLSIGKLSEELSNPKSEFYFAEKDAEVVGYLKINSGAAQTEPQPGNTLEIERIYVAREYLRMKIGHLLLQKALDRAMEVQADFIWLGVWEHNERAIRFYQNNGFEVFGSHQFTLGSDLQTDLLMRKFLSQKF